MMTLGTLGFHKVESVGNHFVLLDAQDMPEMDWSMLATSMCAHHFGVGADGLLVVQRSTKAHFRFRMFNPDGTEDICANGMRCATAYMRTIGHLTSEEATIEAADGLHLSRILAVENGLVNVQLNMGIPSLRPADIPALAEVDRMVDYPLQVAGHMYYVTGVSVGTPHAVLFAPKEALETSIPEVSRAIETHPLFPKRINVTWCAVESRDSLRIRTWERGVGPTLGCGTGACAALVAAHTKGLVGTDALVVSPGGSLSVEWPEERDVFVSGWTRLLYEGKWILQFPTVISKSN